MYSMKDLVIEITQEIDQMRQAGNPLLPPDWITQVIINNHPDLFGDDSDFYRCCNQSTVRDEVRRQLNRFKIKPGLETEGRRSGHDG